MKRYEDQEEEEEKEEEQEEKEEEEKDRDFMTGSHLQVLGSELHTRHCQTKHRQLGITVSRMAPAGQGRGTTLPCLPGGKGKCIKVHLSWLAGRSTNILIFEYTNILSLK